MGFWESMGAQIVLRRADSQDLMDQGCDLEGPGVKKT